MLKKSPRSAWILAAACTAPIFMIFFLLQPPDLGNSTIFEFTALIGLVLFAVTAFTFFTIIARAEARYYGLAGLAGWTLTGLLMALSLAWIEQVYPTTFGLIGIAVIGFVVFRWLSFWLVWKAERIFKRNNTPR
jgi:hypothetical protein